VFIIHIGRPKAGSSSIQHFMDANADELFGLGVIYPEIGKGAGAAHHPLAFARQGRSCADLSRGEWSRLSELGRRNPDKRIVLSSESLSFVRASHIREVRALLGDVPVTIIVYVRDTSATIIAHYNQTTKLGGNLDDFDTYFDRRDLARRWDLIERIEGWAQAFGWSSIRVRALDERDLVGGDLIEDFLSICGVSLTDLGGKNAKGRERRNVSDGWKTVEVIRQLHLTLRNEMKGEPGDAEVSRRAIARRLRTICKEIMSDLNLDAERTTYLSRSQREVCHSVYAREVAKLNDKLGGTIIPLRESPTAIEREFLPAVDQIPVNERRKIAMALERKLVHRSGRPRNLRGVEITPELRHALLAAITL
jgi:hypothetical protein